MSELAYNINGEGFEPPETTTGWRVRRMKPRGAPEVVYGKDGLPLIIPIESDLEELRRSVDAAGRFRLDAVDDRGRNIEGSQPAYVVVPHRAEDHAQVEVIDAPIKLAGTDRVIAEAMRLNTELAKSVIDRFPEMMSAAAELLRAADGAGLPRRAPREVEEEEDDDEDTAAPVSQSFEFINNLIAQVVPIVISGLAGNKMKLSSVLDWRKASAEGQRQKQASAQALDVTTAEVAAEPADETALPPLDPKTMSHFIAIQSALAPNEATLARQVAAELSPTELRAWFKELSEMSVPDAVAKIRGMLGATAKAGGAS